mmetsp:Transcript_30353/g.86859  ORF Transcript_30353/g.86859 Transcript_30353/m.86859 type:complete len:227 (+) Transcript_30353:810-1490(+)
MPPLLLELPALLLYLRPRLRSRSPAGRSRRAPGLRRGGQRVLLGLGCRGGRGPGRFFIEEAFLQRRRRIIAFCPAWLRRSRRRSGGGRPLLLLLGSGGGLCRGLGCLLVPIVIRNKFVLALKLRLGAGLPLGEIGGSSCTAAGLGDAAPHLGLPIVCLHVFACGSGGLDGTAHLQLRLTSLRREPPVLQRQRTQPARMAVREVELQHILGESLDFCPAIWDVLQVR